MATVRWLEERSLNALPALQTCFDDGWILRFANGYTRRSNSVNPLYPAGEAVDTKIERCEALYITRQLKPTFKLTPLNDQDGLEQALERHGYARADGAIVQTLDLDRLAPLSTETALLASSLSESWLADYARLNPLPEAHRTTLRHMLAAIVPRQCYASLSCEGQTVVVGLGVMEQNTLGLFDIVTDPVYRNRGLARRLVLHLLHWGRANGAAQAYLQVVPGNAPAIHLYASLGFRESYRYWYRFKPLP